MTETTLLYIVIILCLLTAVLAAAAMMRAGTLGKRLSEMKADTQNTERQLQEIRQANRDMIQQTQNSLQVFGELISRNQKDSADNLDKRLADINTRFSQMALENEQKLENIRLSMEKKIGELTNDNNRQLEEMRKTVDEKLQKTLEDRITQSFKLVNDRLEQVYKGLGEMQNLAVGGCLLLRGFSHASLHEHVVIEIALVHLPHVHKAQQDYRADAILRLQLLVAHEQQDGGAEHNDKQRAPAVGRED